nr:MAG TPA: hypothetical protein [Caudoviricetes sp.]
MTRCSRACIKESADQECDADSLLVKCWART